MKDQNRRRPPAGVALGVVALVFAVAGTAFGSSDTFAKLTKGKVKAIAAQQVESLASGLEVKSAKNADKADSADTAGSAAIATNVFSANVDSAGNMIVSIPEGATSGMTATGNYRVSFGRNLANCVVSATAANGGTSGPDQGFVSVSKLSGDPNQLQVFTRSTTNTVIDRAFGVQAICPA